MVMIVIQFYKQYKISEAKSSYIKICIPMLHKWFGNSLTHTHPNFGGSEQIIAGPVSIDSSDRNYETNISAPFLDIVISDRI